MIEIDQFKQLLFNAHPGRRYVLALSGGRDSMVLFDLLLQLGDAIDWRVVHVNHALQEVADQWQQHCESWCQQHQIACESFKADSFWKDNTASNLEARARQYRYQCLWSACQPDEILLTGHHQDDQAETLLLQLLRGCGVAGLAAMPLLSVQSDRVHLRPLLNYSSEAMAAYAGARNLPYTDDPSNQNVAHRRNALRQEIIPRLKAIWPATTKLLARTAAHCADSAALLDDLGQMDWMACYDHGRQALDLMLFRLKSPPRQKNLLRYWFRQKGLLMPNAQRLETLLEQMLLAGRDRCPLMHWDSVELRRYQGYLYMLDPLPALDPQWQCTWVANTSLTLPKPLGELTAAHLMVSDDFDPEGVYTVRFRWGGETFKPAGSAHHSTLKQWLQKQMIPPWYRSYLPLIFKGNILVAVAMPGAIIKMINHVEYHQDKETIL